MGILDQAQNITQQAQNITQMFSGPAPVSGFLQDQARGLPLIGNGLADQVKKNPSWFTTIDAKANSLLQWLGDWVMGLFDGFFGTKHKETQQATLQQVDNALGQFNQIAKAVGLDESVGKQLQLDYAQAVKSAFGFAGLGSDQDTVVRASVELQNTLKSRLRVALLTKHGNRLSDEQVDKLASEAAVIGTGLNLATLESKDAELRLKSEKPTTGFSGMLSALQANADSGQVTGFTIDPKKLEIAKNDAAAILNPAAPPSPPATPPGNQVAQAGGANPVR